MHTTIICPTAREDPRKLSTGSGGRPRPGSCRGSLDQTAKGCPTFGWNDERRLAFSGLSFFPSRFLRGRFFRGMFRGRFGRVLRRLVRYLWRLRLGLGRNLWLGFHLGLGFGRWHCNRCHDRSGGGCTFSLAFRHFRLLARRYGGRRSTRRGLRTTPAPRWRRRWRRWRRKRLQEFHGLGSRTQLSIEQQHEDIARNLRVFRQLRSDQQFGHLGQWNALLHLPPFGQKVLDFLSDSLMPSGHRQEQNHLRPRRRKQIPRARRRGRFLAA